MTSLNASFRREKMKIKSSQGTGTGNYKILLTIKNALSVIVDYN